MRVARPYIVIASVSEAIQGEVERDGPWIASSLRSSQ